MTDTPAATEGRASRGGGSAPEADQSDYSYLETSVPRHVAIIMDGNGRWASKRGLPRVAGHRAGAEAVRTTLRAAVKAGVEVLTLYAFSSENWRRSEDEIADLKGLLGYYLERELAELHKQGIRLCLIGNHQAFGPDLTKRLEAAVERTRENSRMTLVIALNYGSRAEIVDASRKLAEKAAAGVIDPAAIDEDMFDQCLETHDWPQLDLLIRTSGEKRLSNFLLWQAAYAELLFLDVLWPDFDENAFKEAVDEFGRRNRRFGGR